MPQRECLALCRQGRDACHEALFSLCLAMGGRHVEQQHVKLMADCAEACQTAANFLMRGSVMSEAMCLCCAEICEACAESCRRIGGSELAPMAALCGEVAAACRALTRPSLRRAA